MRNITTVRYYVRLMAVAFDLFVFTMLGAAMWQAGIVTIGGLTQAKPMVLLGLVVALCAVMVVEALFIIALLSMRTASEQTQTLREAERRELARTIERVRDEEVQR